MDESICVVVCVRETGETGKRAGLNMDRAGHRSRKYPSDCRICASNMSYIFIGKGNTGIKDHNYDFIVCK